MIALFMVMLGLAAVVTPAQARMAFARTQDEIAASGAHDDGAAIDDAAAAIIAMVRPRAADLAHPGHPRLQPAPAMIARTVILSADRAHE
ncbi:hypothetical protein [Croceicoccus hydrothermalis]|uniref:hypothetical protein n=1 Tax=Croceicoccus hydrothermalis TaxID=2867964 RepID=UPI001EFB3A48|nr:hypothetical protein [Croceicoccus hydrothermalis]